MSEENGKKWTRKDTGSLDLIQVEARQEPPVSQGHHPLTKPLETLLQLGHHAHLIGEPWATGSSNSAEEGSARLSQNAWAPLLVLTASGTLIRGRKAEN